MSFRFSRLLLSASQNEKFAAFLFPGAMKLASPKRQGRPWRLEELQKLSNEDLIKLYHVVLKERNMLETMNLYRVQESKSNEQFYKDNALLTTRRTQKDIINTLKFRHNKANYIVWRVFEGRKAAGWYTKDWVLNKYGEMQAVKEDVAAKREEEVQRILKKRRAGLIEGDFGNSDEQPPTQPVAPAMSLVETFVSKFKDVLGKNK